MELPHQRLSDLGAVIGKITLGDDAVILFHGVDDVGGDPAHVKIVRPVQCNLFERIGQFRLLENLSRLVGVSVVEIDAAAGHKF